MKKFLLTLLLNWLVYCIIVGLLKSINHFDSICFLSTVFVSGLIILINLYIQGLR